jgi:hypothetical protein
MSRARVRLVSLLGVAGGAFGLGLHVLGDTDDEKRGFGFAGAGSLAGLGLGTWLTRAYDRNRDTAALRPEIGLFAVQRPKRPDGHGMMSPMAAGIQWAWD